MITLAQCAAFAGLAPNEVIAGAEPSARHRKMLSSYLLNRGWGVAAVREMIVSDLRSFLDLGAKGRAAELVVVLRFLLSDYPGARRAPLEAAPADVTPRVLDYRHDRRENIRCLAQCE